MNMGSRIFKNSIGLALVISLMFSARAAIADGSTYFKTQKMVEVTAPPVQAATARAGLLHKSSKFAGGRAGRAIALTCAALLSSAFVSKVVQAVEDPIRTPYKASLFMPAQGRRGVYEHLLRTAFKKDKARTRYRLPSSDEVELKNDEKTGATHSLALSELIVNERFASSSSSAYYQRIAGYMVVPGLSGYLIAEMGDNGRIKYEVTNPASGEEVAAGELSVSANAQAEQAADEADVVAD